MGVGRSSHGRSAHANQPSSFFQRKEARSDEGGELAEAVTQEISRAHAQIQQFVVTHEGQGEGGELCPIGAHDLLVTGREEQSRDVHLGDGADALNHVPVPR